MHVYVLLFTYYLCQGKLTQFGKINMTDEIYEGNPNNFSLFPGCCYLEKQEFIK